MLLRQRTIARPTSVLGIGLHSGKKVTLKLLPATSDTGIVFQRVDKAGLPPIKAHANFVGATENNTTLGEGAGAVHTVEHLLSALYGFGINNLYIEVDGPEIPIMDGSSGSFVFLLKEAGVSQLNKSREFLVITERVRVQDGEKWAEVSPSSALSIDSTIAFPHPLIGVQKKSFRFSCESYISEIARARTFGLLSDVDYLKRRGLIKGGSLDNAIVLDDFKVVNPEGLRFVDEFVRHKVLDTIGDMSLLGHDIAAKITTYKSGHNIHNQLCRAILSQKSCYAIVSGSALQQEEMAKAFDLPQFISVY